ncbi:MAG TPA: aspartate-semialdehyde dehydrogenase [Longimicrobiales bacterium]|nr:aspartate-semialdehyde dehydrogenase [Longimicrobiales bacterium]
MRVAVLGATGAVGRAMLEILSARVPDVDEVTLLASPTSRGRQLFWAGRERTVGAPEAGCFRGCRLALFSAGSGVSRDWAPVAAGEGAVVVDNSSAWRMDPQVPLVVPEVNAERIRERPKGIIANPNCSTIQVALPLKALRDVAGLRRVIYATYQSASGAGERGLRALREERDARAGPAANGGRSDGSPFPARLAGNVIPSVGSPVDGGWTEEEDKMRAETRKILDMPELPIAATCARVPVAVGHSVAVTVEMETPLSAEEAARAIAAQPGACVDARPFGPLALDAAGTDAVHVGRIRLDRDLPNTIHFWVVADNLRKGAALNAVQIAEQVLAEAGSGVSA